MSIGEVLTAARGQAGLTITQVSQRTRIRETIIRGIERDDFSACGGDFYARGHIRAIARAVGADPEPLIREYDSSHGTPQPNAAAGVPGPAAPLRLRERRRPNGALRCWSYSRGHRPGRLSPGGISARWPRRGAARRPAAAHQAGRSTRPRRTRLRRLPAPGPPDVVISLTAVSEPAGPTSPHRAARRSSRASSTQAPPDLDEQRAVTLRLGNPGAVTLTVDGKSRGLGSAPVTLSLAPGQGISG